MGTMTTKLEYKLLREVPDSQTNEVSDNIIPQKFTIETTVKSISENSKLSFKIECDPKISGDLNAKRCFYLKRAHPNFIGLYNKIKFNRTYKFTYEDNLGYAIVDDITELDTHTTSGIVNGFIDIGTEFILLDNKCEVILAKHENEQRIILRKDHIKDIVIGKTYTFTYTKNYGANLYAVKTYELCDD